MPTPLWSLAQVRDPNSGRPTVALRRTSDGTLMQPPREIDGCTVMEILDRWDELVPVLKRIDLAERGERINAELLAPLTYPRKVICTGANYASHCKEMGVDAPDPEASPFFFSKPPTTTVVGDGASVEIRSERVDWEVELGVILGRKLKDASPDEARSAVAGYVVANDLSDRGAFTVPDAVGAPFAFDWFANKSQDGFCPIGPGLTPAFLIGDAQDVRLQLTVNGDVRQESTTSDMVISIQDLIVGASRRLTLEPGDLILTGTPAGVGAARGEFLEPGDNVVASIESLGSVTTHIIGT